jgi:outer membrane protein assembly factor BamC
MKLTLTMKKSVLAIISASLCLTITACSTVDDLAEKSKIDYKSAGKRPTLEVPPDLTSPVSADRGTSGAASTTASTFQRNAAQGSTAVASTAGVLPTVPGVRVERSGTQRWLAVDMKPEQLWPIVRDFWTDSGFNLAVQSPQTGILETEWAENRAKIPQDGIRAMIGKALDAVYSTGERDKFRVRIDSTASGSELYLSHKGMVESLVGQTKETSLWQPRAADPDLEAEFLRRIVLRLGVDNNRAQAIATSAKGPATNAAAAATPAVNTSKARIVGSGATVALEIADEPFDRGWRRVGLALDRSGFTVEDRNRSEGVYFVRYVDPELESSASREKGFLGKLFSKDSDVKPKTFRITVKSSGTQTNVSVADDKGAALTDPTDQKVATRMVTLIQEQLR